MSNRQQWSGTLALMLSLILALPLSAGWAQGESRDSLLQVHATKVYLDIPEGYHDYVRTEIPYVNYVRDRSLAQVQVMLLEAETGSGGTEYSVLLIGRQQYNAINDTLTFAMEPGPAEDRVRQRLVALLKRGLMRYVEKSPLANDISISYVRRPTPELQRDRWDYWVFSLNTQGYAQGDKTWDNLYMWTYLAANRVTPELKIDLSIGTSYNENNYDVSGGTITSITRSEYFSGLVVKSINDHWSYGLSTNLSESSYSNIDLLVAVAPAIEYDLYPYTSSTRRELRFLYRVYCEYARYVEETIYNKLHENFAKQALSVTYVARQQWGSITATLSGSNFLHDFTKNRLSLTSDLSLNLIKGFSLTLSGQAYRTHDLLSPAKGEASYEDILLRRKQLDSQYTYYFSFGLQYSFGSIYSNVVNPRFGE
ncbi:MAG: hypothetical protein PHD74_07870 [Candidatus Krumholzibacteria bacterium]|nr:hypothetical protein [Candidatus Krumholzibacteria bacterium]